MLFNLMFYLIVLELELVVEEPVMIVVVVMTLKYKWMTSEPNLN